jgi:hypothetical protein
MTVPSVFGLPHLSEDAVAAFADGVLSSAATIRARRHCAECAECAEAVRGQREAAMMLRTASAPALPAGLLDRLAGLPMSAQLPPPLSGLPTAVNSDGVPMFVSYQPVRKPGPVADAPATGPQQSDPSDGSGPEPAPFAPARFEPARPAHRRVLLPVSILASAAAVVAAGAIGSNVSSFQPAVDHPAAVNLLSGFAATNADANQAGTSPQQVRTGPSFAAAFGSGRSGPLIQPAELQAGFSTARLRSAP